MTDENVIEMFVKYKRELDLDLWIQNWVMHASEAQFKEKGIETQEIQRLHQIL